MTSRKYSPDSVPPSAGENPSEDKTPPIHSLKELITHVTGRGPASDLPAEDSGISDPLPFPFIAIVGQMEMKLALTLSLINPNIGGVLLIGPRGTGKTTAVRSLLDLLPEVRRSKCVYGCMPEDIESGGIDAVCPDCAKKYAEGESLTVTEKSHLIELPLNATLDDVVGGFDERARIHDRLRLKRGILAQADQSVLYVDEVNLLQNEIVDALLDAAAMGSYTVRRGPLSATYRSRFTLIGSMNPEEGNLRPQIMDRFGLRIIVHGLTETKERLAAYRRVHEYLENRRSFIQRFTPEIRITREEIQLTRDRLKEISLPDKTAQAGIHLIQQLGIESLRAEITLFETARAYTAADGRTQATLEDLRTVAPMALRLRKSEFTMNYLKQRQQDDQELAKTLDKFLSETK